MIRKNLLVFVGVIVLVLAAGVAGLELSGFDVLKEMRDRAPGTEGNTDVAIQNILDNFNVNENEKGVRWFEPKGKILYNVVSAEGLLPRFVETEIDPLDVHVGDIQKMRVVLENDKEVISVVAHIETDNGTTTVPLKLVSRRAVTQADFDSRKYIVEGGKLVIVPDWKIAANSFLHSLTPEVSATGLERFEYAGEWTVRDTHSRTYQTIFVAKDEAGRENQMTHTWSDPCAPPMDGAWNIDGNCSYSVTPNGVERGNVGFAVGPFTLTMSGPGIDRTDFVWNPGYSFSINNGGQVSIGGGYRLVQTYLWVVDSDADSWAQYCNSTTAVNCIQSSGDSAPGGQYRRRYLMNTSAVDCDDTFTSILLSGCGLTNSVHTSNQCRSAGGTPVDAGGNPVCRFGPSIPGGWTAWGSWSVTSAAYCSGFVSAPFPQFSSLVNRAIAACSGSDCTTGSHGWSNTAQETCGYLGPPPACTPLTCYATINNLGAY